jgi:hypothetical protein
MKLRHRSWRWTFIFGIMLVGLLILFVGLYLWFVKRDSSPIYQARRAHPIINALNSFYAANDRYPIRPGELTPFLPVGVIGIDGIGNHAGEGEFGFNGSNGGINWYYNLTFSGKGYELRCQIRDQSVYCDYDGSNGTWSLDPGDGNDLKNIQAL